MGCTDLSYQIHNLTCRNISFETNADISREFNVDLAAVMCGRVFPRIPQVN